MAKQSNQVRVDGEKIKQIIKDNNLNGASFSRSLGHTGGWEKAAKDGGTIRQTDVLLIQQLYGVDVTYKEPKKKTETAGLAQETKTDESILSEQVTRLIVEISELKQELLEIKSINGQMLDGIREWNKPFKPQIKFK